MTLAPAQRLPVRPEIGWEIDEVVGEGEVRFAGRTLGRTMPSGMWMSSSLEVDDGMSALSSMSASEGGASERGDCDSGMTLRFTSIT